MNPIYKHKKSIVSKFSKKELSTQPIVNVHGVRVANDLPFFLDKPNDLFLLTISNLKCQLYHPRQGEGMRSRIDAKLIKIRK